MMTGGIVTEVAMGMLHKGFWILLMLQMVHGLNKDLSSEHSTSVVAIYGNKSAINPNCTDNLKVKNYYSIYELPHILLNNTEVRICFAVIVLDRNITISNVSNLILSGYEYTYPVIQCLNDTPTGLNFIGIQDLKLVNFTTNNCGFWTQIAPDTDQNIKVSINIQECINVILDNVNITNGPGTGLSLFYNNGLVLITNCTFKHNGWDRKTGGNGVYMETSDSRGLATENLFNDCKFIDNVANTGNDEKIKGFSRFDKGGGLCIYILGSKQMTLSVENSIFSGNVAGSYGGGMFSTFHGDSANDTIFVSTSFFTRNRAKYGGAYYAGYLHSHRHITLLITPLNCSHIIRSCQFMNNSAIFGGGTSVFSTKTFQNSYSGKVTFNNCTWMYNSGQYGAALTILPNAWNLYSQGYLPAPVLTNCRIESNYVKYANINFYQRQNFQQFSKGAGAVYCSVHTITFRNKTDFIRNNGSALYSGSCLIVFDEYSIINFTENSGYHGGAILQPLSSVVYLSNHARLYFNRNTAYGKGGAIYQQSVDMHMLEYSKTCFINYINDEVDINKRNISVQFIDNQAGTGNNAAGYGHSIYVSSLLPCYSRFSHSATNLSFHIFDQVGNFSYFPINRSMEIATAVNHSLITGENFTNIMYVIPGKQAIIPYSDRDDLNQSIITDYWVTIENEGDSDIQINKDYSLISDNTLLLNGRANDEALVTLSTTSSHLIAMSFKVKMQQCPPGFIQQNFDKNETGSCICSVNSSAEYTGINKCNQTLVQAYRQGGLWVGYEYYQTESEDSLRTGYCPFGFCTYDNLLLPPKADREEVNRIVCTGSCTGKLCGKCKANFSVHHHSLNFECKSDRYCKWGWLFYILSEIVPVTIIFFIIILFNIPFTSGAINGFIFYSQVVEMLHITGSDLIPFPRPAQIINIIRSFINLSMNLDLFVLEELSFCLWKNANVVDSIAFKYITLIYSFLLIVLIVLLINKCSFSCRYNQRLLKCFKSAGLNWPTLEGSIIHGLTAFLILCYAQCARTSILLLIPSTIRGKGSQNGIKVVYYYGEYTWMGHQHLPYAIPALLFITVIVLLPPTLLLVYPIHYRIFSHLRIAESRCVHTSFHPIERLKPFFDSFQSCFKDEYRFFSGLYFVYRFGILINLTIYYLQDDYFALEVQFVAMIVLHAICQPYKKRLHNIIDTLLFGNLAIINAITIHNLMAINAGGDTNRAIEISTMIQVILMALPVPIAIFCLVVNRLSLKRIKENISVMYGSFDELERK